MCCVNGAVYIDLIDSHEVLQGFFIKNIYFQDDVSSIYCIQGKITKLFL
jgi:hypothetical protein